MEVYFALLDNKVHKHQVYNYIFLVLLFSTTSSSKVLD